MKRNIKVIISAVSLALSMFFFIAGVYSSASRNVGITGQISFTPIEVYLDYTIKQTEPYEYRQSVLYSTTAEGSFTTGTNQDGKSVGLGNIQLNDYQRFFTYQITFTRIAGFVREYYISAEKFPTSNDIYAVTSTFNGESNDFGTLLTVGTAVQTVTITITFEVHTSQTLPSEITSRDIGSAFILNV
jgi:hypothetical protein